LHGQDDEGRSENPCCVVSVVSFLFAAFGEINVCLR